MRDPRKFIHICIYIYMVIGNTFLISRAIYELFFFFLQFRYHINEDII